MIDMILGAIWAVLQGLISLILMPVDLAIQAAFPDVADGIQSVIVAMQGMTSGIDVARSWVPIPGWVVGLYLVMIIGGLGLLTANAIPGVFRTIQKVKFW